MWGLHSGGGGETALEEFLRTARVSFPILKDAGAVYGQYRRSGAVSPYPLDYVIDQQGRVAYAATEYNPHAIQAVVERLVQDTSGAGPLPGGPAWLTQLGGGGRVRLGVHLPAAGRADLDLFDLRGRRVRRLWRGVELSAGDHALTWDGRDAAGRPAAAGVYLARLVLDGRIATARLVLAR